MAFNKQKALEKARKFASKGQHDKAAREYEAVVDAEPSDIRAWLMLADCLVRSGEVSQAIDRYLRVGGHYEQQGEAAKAIAVYRQVLALEPGRVDVHLRMAGLHQKLGHLGDAVACLEHVAGVELHAGNVREALRCLTRVAELDPGAVGKRLRVAELCSKEGLVGDAVLHFRTAADALLAGGKKPEYVKVAERLVYHKADDWDTVRELSRVYLELGEPRRALIKLNGLLHANPTDPHGLEILADTFFALGKPDKATSVILEVARSLRANAAKDSSGPEATLVQLRRVLRRGLAEAPQHPDLLALWQELEGPSSASVESPPRVEAFEDDLPSGASHAEPSGLEELDDDDLLVEVVGDSKVAKVEPVGPAMRTRPAAPPSRGTVPPGGASSLTHAVLSETPGRVDGDAPSSDVDKYLLEARVYVKYRLFEHALEHLALVFAEDPDHVDALGLRARACAELGQIPEAAAAHVRAAELVAARDRDLARKNLEAALALIPDHPEATRALAALEAGAGVPSVAAEEESRPGDAMLQVDASEVWSADELDFSDEALGVNDGFEVRAGAEPVEESGVPGPIEDSPSTVMGPEQDFAIEWQEHDDLVPASADEPAAIEDRFGFGDDDEASSEAEGVAQPTAFVESGEVVEAEDLEADDLEGDDLEADDLEEDPTAKLELSLSMAPSPLDEDQETAVRPRPSPPRLPAAAAAAPIPSSSSVAHPEPDSSTAKWPDLSEDLAELRFFRQQGLDEDLEFGLSELRARCPGHPAVLAFEAEIRRTAEPPPEGATPLVSIEDEEEDDAYLSAIFEVEAPARAGGGDKAPAASARPRTGVTETDASTLFDLGVAYRGMGLEEEALEHFSAAAHEPVFRSRALVMLGAIHLARGEVDLALQNFEQAAETAQNADELQEAHYQLALSLEAKGQAEDAAALFETLEPGFRDRDARLSRMGRGQAGPVSAGA